jgi:hypothetical protein
MSAACYRVRKSVLTVQKKLHRDKGFRCQVSGFTIDFSFS